MQSNTLRIHMLSWCRADARGNQKLLYKYKTKDMWRACACGGWSGGAHAHTHTEHRSNVRDPSTERVQHTKVLCSARLGLCSRIILLFPGPRICMSNSFTESESISISDCCFAVQVPKGPRGLGLSVSGGVDTNAAFPGLIRIKRLFPNQSAWCTGMLQPGDILLEANAVPLTGLTNHVIWFLRHYSHSEMLDSFLCPPDCILRVIYRFHELIFFSLSLSFARPIIRRPSKFCVQHQTLLH